MSPYHALQAALQTRPPMLEFVSHQQAHDDFDWKVTRDTLTRLGYPPHLASRLAAKVTGSPRARLDKLIGDKHIVI
jgi:hypothetical protein